MRCITLASRVCERSDQQLRHGGTYWEWHLKVLDGKGLRLSCCSVVGEGSGRSGPANTHRVPRAVLRASTRLEPYVQRVMGPWVPLVGRSSSQMVSLPKTVLA